jgi:hypothetical protein
MPQPSVKVGNNGKWLHALPVLFFKKSTSLQVSILDFMEYVSLFSKSYSAIIQQPQQA